jgi:hypothetical protein
MRKHLLLLLLTVLSHFVFAQVDTTAEEEEDFSQYANLELSGGAKRYCTSKVLGLSPNKLISLGYDFQTAHTLKNTDPNANGAPYSTSGTANITAAHGVRVAANVPLISNTKWLINLGGNYWQTQYDMSSHTKDNYFIHQLHHKSLSTLGLNLTAFKPLDEKHFILAFASADANGNFVLIDDKIGDYISRAKYTLVGFYGWKRSDLSMFAVGASRTYRPGAQGIIPLILFNHTFENRKWGIESLFPARLNVRRSFNPRNLLLFGYELEGNSYAIINRATGVSPYGPLELRRSELRPRITYEKSISGFIWLSVQAGYRIAYNFNVDDKDYFRLIGSDRLYFIENTLGGAFYFNVSLNLVSP